MIDVIMPLLCSISTYLLHLHFARMLWLNLALCLQSAGLQADEQAPAGCQAAGELQHPASQKDFQNTDFA